MVIKYGGAAMTDPDLKEEFARDAVLLKYVGSNPVVVHGGGPDITRYMERLGMEVKFVDGLRVSDEATVEVAKMVLVGKQNKDIVPASSATASPRSGCAATTACCSRSPSSWRRETPTSASSVRSSPWTRVLLHIAEDYIPVIAFVGAADREGNSYNVNADAAAAAVAEALGATR